MVSFMCDGSFSASGLRNTFTQTDCFSVWLLTEEKTGRPELLGLWILGSMHIGVLSLLALEVGQSPSLI